MSELHVLLVEDSEDDRLLAARAFRRLPFPVRFETARDGSEALARLHGTTDGPAGPLPTVVFLDLQMPKLSGREVLEHLRSTPATRELPVVVISSSNHPEDSRRCRELGVCDYLAKPLDTDHLREVLAAFRTPANS